MSDGCVWVVCSLFPCCFLRACFVVAYGSAVDFELLRVASVWLSVVVC